MPRVRPFQLLATLGLLGSCVVVSRPSIAAGSARIIGVAVKGSSGVAYHHICTAVPGNGRVFFNGLIADDPDGASLVLALRSALTALRSDPALPGGGADHTKFDLTFEVDGDRATIHGGPSGALGRALIAYSAMTGHRLRQDVAVTGDLSADGRAGAIGGLEAKVPAAIRAGANFFIVPAGNDAEIMKLPVRQRVEIAIFGVTNLNQALQVALAPDEPAARQFNAYLQRRKEALRAFVDLYERYQAAGGVADERASLRPADARIYSAYFSTHPTAGGPLFAAMQGTLEQYPWDESLKTIYEGSKRMRMALAAIEEAQSAEQLLAGGQFLPAYERFNQAALLNPAIVRYKSRARTAVEEHFKSSFRTTIEEAGRLYAERKFADASATYHRLSELTKEYPTSFPLLERIAEARARAAASPDISQHKLAGLIASRAGFYPDAAEEYETLLQAEPNAANAGLLFGAYFDTSALAERVDYSAAVKMAMEQAKKLATQVKPEEAAQVYLRLAEVEQERQLLSEAVVAMDEAAALDKSAPIALRLAQALIRKGEGLAGEARKGPFKRAQEVLSGLAETVARDESAYGVREAIDRETGGDNTPPFLQLDARPRLSAGSTISGTVQFSLFVRDVSGVSQVELLVDGMPLSHQDTGEAIRATINIGSWDTLKATNGKHRLEVEATDAKGNKARVATTVEVYNEVERIGVVWGHTDRKFYHLPTCPRAPEFMFRAVFQNPKQAEIAKFRPCPHCIR